jgi:hypothetical protein
MIKHFIISIGKKISTYKKAHSQALLDQRNLFCQKRMVRNFSEMHYEGK